MNEELDFHSPEHEIQIGQEVYVPATDGHIRKMRVTEKLGDHRTFTDGNVRALETQYRVVSDEVEDFTDAEGNVMKAYAQKDVMADVLQPEKQEEYRRAYEQQVNVRLGATADSLIEVSEASDASDDREHDRGLVGSSH